MDYVSADDIMMKKALLIVLILLCGTSLLHGQVADSVSWHGQGKTTLRIGSGLMVSGAITAAAGAGMILYAISQDNVWGGVFLSSIGIVCAATGALIVVAGIPITVAGHSIREDAICPGGMQGMTHVPWG